MTTPATMNRILESLRTRLADAERDCANGRGADQYSEGYDDGFRDAIKEVLTELTGDAP